MRILVTTTPGARNLAPVQTFCHGFQRAGHDVLVAVERSGAEQVRAAGLECHSLDPAVRVDMRAACVGLLDAVGRWRPELMVHETAAYAAVPAAEAAGLPVARIAVVSGTQELLAARAAAPSVDALRAEMGLPRDPHGARVLAGRGLTLIPEALESEPVALERFREPAPWPRRLPDLWPGDARPLVALALGERPVALHRAALDALAALPVRVLVTAGAELGELPPGACLNPGLALVDALPYADVLLCDGSSSALCAGLTTGTPMVAVPLGSGQIANAAAMADSGAGLALQSGDVGAARSAVRALLRGESYREAARRAAADIAALPLVDDAVAGVLTSA